MATYSVTFFLANNTTQFSTTVNAINLEAATNEVQIWLTKGSVRLQDLEDKTETLMTSTVLRFVVMPEPALGKPTPVSAFTRARSGQED